MIAGTPPEAAGFLELSCQPLHEVRHLGEETWLSLGGDPQFVLHWPASLQEGPYRITLRVEGVEASGPTIYLDQGHGWSEATCVHFQDAGGGAWVLDVWLPGAPAAARLDPVARPGEFSLGAVRVERLGPAEALLAALRRRAAAAPDDAADLLLSTHRLAETDGLESAWQSLRSPRAPRTAATTEADDYLAWVDEFDTLSPGELKHLHRRIGQLPSRPLISLLVLPGSAGGDALRRCLSSVSGQAYPDWELIVVPGRSDDMEALAVARAFAEADRRVRVHEPVQAGTPAARVVSALSEVQGALVGVLDGAAVLASHALLAFAEAVLDQPGACILYADSDRIDLRGRRSSPYFKPDWNPELFLAHDYLGPLTLYSAVVLRAAAAGGDLSEDDEDAVAACLALRCAATCDAADIVHVPLMLAHGGEVPGLRQSAGARRALLEHLEVWAPGAAAVPSDWGHEIQWPLPDVAPTVSLVVPTRDRVELLRRCVDSICEVSTYPHLEVLVVDNQSVEPETLEYLEELRARPNVRVLRYDAPFNYAAINNFAVGEARGEIVGLINNDIEIISPDWLERMVQHAVRPDVGAVGALLYYPDDTIQHAGVIVGLGGVAGHPYLGLPRGAPGQMGRARLVQELTAVTGACLVVRREAFVGVGGLDERLAVAFNDIDLCLRLRDSGLRNIWTPHAELYHHESASRGAEDTPAKRARFQSEVEHMVNAWSGLLARDPAYHPSLSLLHDDAFKLGRPPRLSAKTWIRSPHAAMRT